jgi:hypothetical protein
VMRPANFPLPIKSSPTCLIEYFVAPLNSSLCSLHSHYLMKIEHYRLPRCLYCHLIICKCMNILIMSVSSVWNVLKSFPFDSASATALAAFDRLFFSRLKAFHDYDHKSLNVIFEPHAYHLCDHFNSPPNSNTTPRYP